MSKRVLVVDDDENTVRFLSVALSENGYDPVSAFDGEEGLKKVQESKPDLILLDVMMPKKTGFVLFKQLRRKEEYKDIPVIMLTAVADVLEEDESQASGDTFERPFDSLRESLKKTITKMREEGLVRPEKFIDKPIDPDELVAAVKELIGE
ncbi:MAG: response regulator [Gemmatimonadota bacterium]|nr:MAG: response regulator [Gemmatimonadota bacterium]